jgi:hypothetical protein
MYPKADKAKVGSYTPGGKGNFFIQGMIHPCYGNEFREQRRIVLKKKEIPEYGNNTAQGAAAQRSVSADVKNNGAGPPAEKICRFLHRKTIPGKSLKRQYWGIRQFPV